jgi:hypothetical protein
VRFQKVWLNCFRFTILITKKIYLLTLHQNLVYVERKYTCISNGKSCLLKKIILKNYFDITSKNQLRCNQEQCHPATYNYTYVDEAGKKSSMLIEYGIKIPRREVYVAGKKINF